METALAGDVPPLAMCQAMADNPAAGTAAWELAKVRRSTFAAETQGVE